MTVCNGNSRCITANSIGICLVCEECQPCLFLLDMKAQQSHAEAHNSRSGYLIKETSVTGYGDRYFSRVIFLFFSLTSQGFPNLLKVKSVTLMSGIFDCLRL